MKIRIRFSKHGAMKFIGHLDVMRYFQKAVRRAGFNVVYSTGFSPHQIMAFAAPLGVGLESESEYFDLEVADLSNSELMVRQLDEQMAEGFRIRDIVLLPDNAPNAMASVAAASYSIRFREDRKPTFDIKEAVDLFNSKSEVKVIKQTKKSEIELDIKPSVYKLEIQNDMITMLVDASSAGNIKPDLVINTLYSFYEEEPALNAFITTRIETFGRNNDNKLVPLLDFGQSF